MLIIHYIKKPNSDSGFGLIEVMLASIAVAVLIGLAAVFFSFFIRNYNFSFQENRIVTEAETSLRKVSSEIREARTSESGAYPLVIANDQEIQFYSDANNDGKVDKVRYFLTDNTLSRGIIEPEDGTNAYPNDQEQLSIISDYVVNDTEPIFYYYNGNWPGDQVNNPLVQESRLLETRLVRIRVLINTQTTPDIQDFEVDTQVMIRNLKSN